MTEDPNADSNFTRRKFLRSTATFVLGGAGFVAAGVVDGVTGAAGEDIYNSIHPKLTDDEVDRKLLSALFDVGQLKPSIYAGDGNIQGKAVGINDVSPYLQFSSATLVDFIANTLKISRAHFEDNAHPSFEYDPDQQAIFLGSPVANPVSHFIMGYMPIGPDRNSVPQVDYNNLKTRWSFMFGDSEFGVYDGRLEVAGRYGTGKPGLVHRPIYKLIDKHEGRIETPSTTGGMLNHEWLTIVRILDHGKFKTVVAGMHGSGTKSFFVDFRRNIERLHALTESLAEYQIVVPVELDHPIGLDGVRRTTGQIDWKRARLQGIS